jgi:hypothetical protein
VRVQEANEDHFFITVLSQIPEVVRLWFLGILICSGSQKRPIKIIFHRRKTSLIFATLSLRKLPSASLEDREGCLDKVAVRLWYGNLKGCCLGEVDEGLTKKVI